MYVCKSACAGCRRVDTELQEPVRGVAKQVLWKVLQENVANVTFGGLSGEKDETSTERRKGAGILPIF